MNTHESLLNNLFAIATALLEDTIEIAVSGQSSRRSARFLAVQAAKLLQTGEDLVTLAKAVETVARLSAANEQRSQKRSPDVR